MGQQELPGWARRIRRERELRGWSQADAVAALLAHGDHTLPSRSSVLRRWKSWEAGEHLPDNHYQRLIAEAFGTVQHAIFPGPAKRDRDEDLLAATGMGSLEILARVQRSDIDATTLEALRITVDRLCSDYPTVPAAQLLVEGRSWLGRVAELRNGPLTLAQHREILVVAGWLALLVGCAENDLGDRRSAEATRRAALSIGADAGHAEIRPGPTRCGPGSRSPEAITAP